MVNQAEFAALLDEFKKLKARIDQTEELLAQWDAVIMKLQQDLKDRVVGDSPSHTRQYRDDEIKLVDLPSFEGDELHPLTTFDDVCSLATKLNKQNKGKGSIYGQFLAPKAEPITAATAQESGQQPAPKVDTVAALKGKLEKVQFPQQPTKKTVCYRCQGLGHVAKQCPNRSMVTRE
ncbi:Protein air1 [Bienertia sinuspersici]